MFWRKRRRSEDFRQEIEAHIAGETDRLTGEGLSQAEARSAALRTFGNRVHAEERFYETQHVMWLHNAFRDIRYAFRTLSRNRVFSAVVLLTLAIGIGSTTAIFSVFHSLLLKPLPYPDSDRLVRLIVNRLPGQPSAGGPLRVTTGVTLRELDELRSRMKSLSSIGVYGPALMTMTGGGEATRLEGAKMSASIWQTLGAKPVLGRTFGTREEAPGAGPVIVLSNAIWKRYFQGDPNVLGRTLVLEDSFLVMLGNKNFAGHYTIIGVMPEEFSFPNRQAGFWIPVVPSPTAGGAVLAGLAGGISTQAASAEMNSVLRQLRPRAQDMTFELSREQDEIVGPVRRPLAILMAAVAFVLLIACVNVANLLLARSIARQREVAIRIALGSGRGRLVGQYLAEGLVLSLCGAAAGLLLAYGGVHLLQSLAYTLPRMDLGTSLPFPRLNDVTIDVRVLGFVLAISLAVGLLFGLLPLLGRFGGSQSQSLKNGIDTGQAEGRPAWMFAGGRFALVVSEIAMAMMLLVGGGLLIRSFLKLSMVDPGYERANVLTFQLALPGGRYSVPQLKELAERLVAELEKTPGVEGVAYAHQLPTVMLRQRAFFRTVPAVPEQGPPGTSAEDARFVSRDYFKVFGVRMKEGRAFNEDDRARQPRVLIVNESLARKEFSDRNPVGQIAYLGRDSEPWQIVGVVPDIRQFGLDRPAEPQVFADFRQWPGVSPIGDAPQYFAVRTNGDPFSTVQTVRGVIRSIDSEAGLYNIATLDQLVANSMVRPRLYAVLLGIFAGVAVMLAGIGIYGLMGYSVVRRTREIGIRMALGAPSWQVRNLVLRQTMVLAGIGMVVGCAGAAAMTRFLQGMLFGIEPFDWVTLASVVGLFLFVAALASYIPARRATKIDPVVALRSE